jgi:SPP1 family predicted phage head-tail adaptor
MNAGALDQLVTFERKTATTDGGGGFTEAWAELTVDPEVWANVEAKGGRESLIEGRQAATFVVVFTVWNRDDITEIDRIIWNGVAYNIRGILRTGDRRLMLRIEAERGVGQ